MFKSRTPSLLAIGITTGALVLAACSSDAAGDDPAPDDGAVETVAVAPLEVLTQPDQIDGFVNFNAGTDKTFGHFMCVNVDNVDLTTIEPISIEGEIEFLGSLIYETDEAFVAAVDGFPPDGLDLAATSNAEGATVTIGCEVENPTVKTQLLLGANRTGAGGGKIDGIRVIHSEGTLEILDYEIILCGDDYEYCESLRPES